MSRRLAVYHPTAGVQPKHNPFGKDVANVELFRAVARHGDFDRIDFLTGGQVSAQALVAGLLKGEAPKAEIGVANIMDLRPAAEAGALLRGHPDLADLAWLRRAAGHEARYSLLGVVHTIAPPAMRQIIGGAAVSPVQPWDAVICTSPAVKAALGEMFDGWTGFLAERYGGGQGPRPHMPILPLGVDGRSLAALADRPQVRAGRRAELGLAEDEVMILWVGRLSFFEKAFPQPMFKAAELAARQTGARVHLVMAGWFPNEPQDRDWYRQAALVHAPSVKVSFVDGNDRDRVGGLWAAADIFISLVDNIQETFGITPLEAMAAGLPVVVSDWDGYRFTVRDGEEGFLIRTLGGGRGAGQRMILNHAIAGLPYQAYVGAIAQHTAVHVGDAAARLADLIRSPDLRARMGAAGRRRIAEAFDWPVVVGQLQDLLEELAQVRQAAAPQLTRYLADPVKGEPYAAFAGFATEVLAPSLRLRLAPGASAADLAVSAEVALDQYGGSWRAGPEECAAMLARIEAAGELSVTEILALFPQGNPRRLALGLGWLCKLGVLDWGPPG